MVNNFKNNRDNQVDKLRTKFPWLQITTTVEKYIEPNYYDHLLKNYVFYGKSDLEYFRNFLDGLNKIEYVNVLELGCGSGRVTKVFLENYSKQKYNLEVVDLSDRMLKFCKKIFGKDNTSIKYFQSDSVAYLQKSKGVYDIIFSLWSFSHSVHQILSKKGSKKREKYIQRTIEKTIQQNMKKESVFFLIHFDSLSDEQRILMLQWRKVFSIFRNINKQSPSKILLDEVLIKLQKKGIIQFKTNHYIGKAIEYSSMEEALEIFLNFHMESYFNESKLLPSIIHELSKYFQKKTQKNGKIKIRPGCFIYVIKKI